MLWVTLLLLVGCMEDEDYSVSPHDVLAFSKDTVAFDTVMTGMATNTYTFQVYNHGEKSIRIPKVYLEKGAESPFYVNVDGSFLEGGEVQGLEIGGGDSLRVFLFLNAPEGDDDQPRLIADKLCFHTEGGRRQEVVLEAYGQDVIRLEMLTIDKDTLLSAKRPYHITDTLLIKSGVTLTIGEGTQLYFHPRASLVVKGTLKACGTLGQPIVMRGDRLGYMFSDQPYDRIPGQWGGVVFMEGSIGNVMNGCDIHSGNFGIRCDSSDVSKLTLTLENSIIHNVKNNGLAVRNAQVFVGNSQITNAGGNCVFLRGGNSTFVHCTIGNFYVFAGGNGVALDFANYEGEVRLPLYSAAFYNSILTGYSTDEIMGSQSERYTEDAFDYFFHHCLLNTPTFEDARVSNCFWDLDDQTVSREGNFTPDFDLDKLVFNFDLKAESQAVGNADIEITQSFYPFDLKGNVRLADGKADLGCYECIPTDTIQ